MSLLVYHTGYAEIRCPDVRRGRRNADFGQGFYLTPDEAFARRWAHERTGCEIILNTYDLDLTGLDVYRLERGREWFDTIFANRRTRPDGHDGADVIIGPVANDTIFDTLGLITSGLLEEDKALALLSVGPGYRQIVLRTEKAASRLTWLSARALADEELAATHRAFLEEQKAYQALFARTMQALYGDTGD